MSSVFFLAMVFARALIRYPGLAISAQPKRLPDQPSVVATSGENRPGGAANDTVLLWQVSQAADGPTDRQTPAQFADRSVVRKHPSLGTRSSTRTKHTCNHNAPYPGLFRPLTEKFCRFPRCAKDRAGRAGCGLGVPRPRRAWVMTVWRCPDRPHAWRQGAPSERQRQQAPTPVAVVRLPARPSGRQGYGCQRKRPADGRSRRGGPVPQVFLCGLGLCAYRVQPATSAAFSSASR
jgi:hypothetical protein